MRQRKIFLRLDVAAFFLSALALNYPVAYAAPATPDPQAVQALISRIQALETQLDERLPANSFGVSLPRIDSPSQIVAVIDQLERELVAAKNSSPAFSRPEVARSVVLKALMLLYKGRGNTTPRDGKGWYPANRSGANGLGEIDNILSRSLLDQEGKQRFEDFLNQYNPSDAAAKRNAGFPPQFEIATDATKARVLSVSQSASVAAPYQPTPKVAGNQPTIKDLLSASKASEGDKDAAASFLNGAESNYYEKSVSTLNDPSKNFIDYFGREKESREIMDAMTKIEKGHILITGKAGTGKTTIMKMLSDKLVKGDLHIRNEKPPILVELPITSVTNPSDPSAIRKEIAGAKKLSQVTGRRVILYVDEAHISTPMTRNAIKGFLTETISAIGEDSKVNLVFSTTSNESREFLQDSAFSRRFTEVHVKEFDKKETIQLIRQAYEPQWKKAHQKKGLNFSKITDDAYEYAYRYGSTEQPHAGNPTGPKELLEATIVRKLNEEAGKATGDLTIDAHDVREYLRDRLGMKLIAGDPNFEKNFQEKMEAFNKDYVGNDGAKVELEKSLRTHFGSLKPAKMTALAVFGPPGGGKSFGAEQVSNHFFDGAMLTLNGAEYKNGGLELNKLIGSPSGTVGSEEQRSVLTKFIKDHPHGGVIKIEEADYLHRDVIQLLTNMITDKKFTDGLGKEWDTSRFMIWSNSNIGQDLMIPVDPKSKLTWDQYRARRTAATEKVVAEGKEFERVKPEKLNQVFQDYIGTIVSKSESHGDTSEIQQEAAKQRRRYTPLYILPPTREELEAAVRNRVAKFTSDAKIDHGVDLVIPEQVALKAAHIDGFEFDKGYSYIQEQLEDKIFRFLTPHLSERGKKVTVSLAESQIQLNGRSVPSQSLKVQIDGKPEISYSLGALDNKIATPWAQDPAMSERIKKFTSNMSQDIKGNTEVLQDLADLFKLKKTDWSTRPVVTLLGTSGNGKTETAKAIAKNLYGDPAAFFKMTNLTDKFALGNYIRPPSGIVGSNEETEFERWLKTRARSGGGVICLDELLSFAGLTQHEIAGRLEALNMLYDLLDEGFIKIGKETIDARAFTVVLTGNSMQEAFQNIPNDPGSQKAIQRILKSIGKKDIVDYFTQRGLDAPKVARFGRMYVMGPQPKSVQMEIGRKQVNEIIRAAERNAGHPLKIKVPEEAVQGVVEKLSSITLGMREVNRGYEDIVKKPIAGILSDIPAVDEIEMKIDKDGAYKWFANGKEVAFEGVPINAQGLEERNWNYVSDLAKGSHIRTPQLSDLQGPELPKFTPEALETVATHEVHGHWMTAALLNRKNTVQAISLYPGKGYLGYVQPLADEMHRTHDLSGLIKEAIVLDAGHRAVFVKGRFATGGGAINRSKDHPPADDLGKIEQIKDMLINNRLIPGITENSPPREISEAKRFLGEFFDNAADSVIQEGLKSKEFDGVYQQVLADKFIGQDEIDSHLKNVNWDKFGKPEDFFQKHVKEGMAKALQGWKAHVPETGAQFAASLSKGIEERVHAESGVHSRELASATKGSSKFTKAFQGFCQRTFSSFVSR